MSNYPKRIAVIGLGYMGLPLASLLAQAGFDVSGVDVNGRKIKTLLTGKTPFSEPGLDKLFKKNIANLSFYKKPVQADVHIIAVPTPATKQKRIDLSFVKIAAESIVSVLRDGDLVILESTVGPRSSQVVKKILSRSKKNFLLAHCPERAFPGNTIYELVHNDRIIGGETKEAAIAARNIYSKIVKGRIFLTDITTAETVKLLENTYRNVNIAFANEVARLAHVIGIDAWEAIELANHHPRVNIHMPGPGVGGHCIPLDPWFLIEGKRARIAALTSKALKFNEKMPEFIIGLLKKEEKTSGKSLRKIGILGFAYKKNVDDARETPAHHLASLLVKSGKKVRVSDPFVKQSPFKMVSEHNLMSWADCVMLVTDHDVYNSLDFGKYPNLKLVFDTRNAITKEQKATLGEKLFSFGNAKGILT